MHPTLVRDPFHRPGWIYEEKIDGWRMLAQKDGDRVRLISRNGIDHTRRFPEIAAAVASLEPRTLVRDGEVAGSERVFPVRRLAADGWRLGSRCWIGATRGWWRRTSRAGTRAGRTRSWIKVKQRGWTLSEHRWQRRITTASP